MKHALAAAMVLGTLIAQSAVPALAAGSCLTKYAVATSSTADQAKWYALETTVQSVSWGLWPGYVATSKVEGYSVRDTYRCSPDTGGVTCHVTAVFCKN